MDLINISAEYILKIEFYRNFNNQKFHKKISNKKLVWKPFKSVSIKLLLSKFQKHIKEVYQNFNLVFLLFGLGQHIATIFLYYLTHCAKHKQLKGRHRQVLTHRQTGSTAPQKFVRTGQKSFKNGTQREGNKMLGQVNTTIRLPIALATITFMRFHENVLVLG